LKILSLVLDSHSLGEASYQTAPLGEYDSALLGRAVQLFEEVKLRIGHGRARRNDGSFSILADANEATAAKIVLYQMGKGKMNGADPMLYDGIYILIRVAQGNLQARTIGVAPWHDIRFAYFRLMQDQPLDEMADFIVACAACENS